MLLYVLKLDPEITERQVADINDAADENFGQLTNRVAMDRTSMSLEMFFPTEADAMAFKSAITPIENIKSFKQSAA